jgi:hypothetical protein
VCNKLAETEVAYELLRTQFRHSTVKLEDPIETREGNSQNEARVDAMPHDRKYLELADTFAIVIIAPNDDDTRRDVWLMQLDEKGEIDFDHEEFVLAQTTTRDAALNYAMKLAGMLKLRVLEIAKTERADVMQHDWEYVELRRRIAIVIMTGVEKDGRQLQGVWLKQLKSEKMNWDLFMEQGAFLDDNVEQEFLLCRTMTVDDVEDYAKRLSDRLELRVFRVENDDLRDKHRIIEQKTT